MESAVADSPIADGEPPAVAPTPAKTMPPSVVAYGYFAAAAAALLPTVFSSSVFSWTFTPKLAVLLVVGAVGAVPLVRLARSSQVTWAARGAMAFLGVALVSALLSPAVNIGIFGLYQWGTGWLFWLGCAGAFAIGASLKPEQLKFVLGGIVFAATANSLVAVLQVVGHPTGALGLYQGVQSDGLLGNPIHLEGLLLGVLSLIAGRASTGANRRLWWPMVLLSSVALEFTLERVAIPILLVIIAASLVVYGVRKAAPFALLIAVGYGGAYASKGSALGHRVASGTASTTYGTRLHIWSLALQSLAHHPLVGVGPGELISVIAPHVSSSFAAHLGVATLPTDSHDFIIEVLATTGILGLLAFGTWLGGAALKVQGPFLACAVAMLAVELVEPLNVGVTPVALLALGAATVSVAGRPVGLAALRQWRRTAPTDLSAPDLQSSKSVTGDDDGASGGGANARKLPLSSVVTTVLVAASLFVGVTMVVGDHYLLTTDLLVSPQPKIATAIDANRLLPYWAESASQVADGYEFASNENNGGLAPLREALVWYRTAASRFPADPSLPAEIATIEIQLGDPVAAQVEDMHALALDPWTYLALEGLGTVAMKQGDYRTSLYWYRRALLVAPEANDLVRLIKSDETHLASS